MTGPARARPTTVVLAEDHHVVRQGLRALLDAESDVTVVGEEADGLRVADLVARLRPAVLVLDLGLPGLGGLEVLRQVRRRTPGSAVVILSMHANQAYVAEALRRGAAGYVLKEASAGDLVRAVRAAAAGRRYLSPPLSLPAVEAYLARAASTALDRYETLTAREREVLHLTAEGHSATTIAARLHISSRTVESHRANLMRKLGLRSQTELARYAAARGLVPLEVPPGPVA